jgi:hypothetical protein
MMGNALSIPHAERSAALRHWTDRANMKVPLHDLRQKRRDLAANACD